MREFPALGMYTVQCTLLEKCWQVFTENAIAQLYVKKFSTISLHFTKLYVTLSFAIASSVKILQNLFSSFTMHSVPKVIYILLAQLSDVSCWLLCCLSVWRVCSSGNHRQVCCMHGKQERTTYSQYGGNKNTHVRDRWRIHRKTKWWLMERRLINVKLLPQRRKRQTLCGHFCPLKNISFEKLLKILKIIIET